MVDAMAARALAGFWLPIEAAASSLETASVEGLPGAMAGLVDLLAGDLIPRLHAEESVLLPLLSTQGLASHQVGVDHAAVSRLAETISTFALRPSVSDVDRVRRIASRLLTVLGKQREAEARLVARVCTLPAADRDAAALGDRLEEEARASRSSQFFVSPAKRLPTEAWVLRQNPKPVRLGVVAHERTSAVADLVAVLESA
jgi:hypothetical protein